MSNFPTLSEMGIQYFDDISSYDMRQYGNNSDMLKITYKRKKGSLLPKHKTFRFGRSIKGIKDQNAPNHIEEVYEISPFLQKAVTELEKIVGTRNNNLSHVERLLDKIEHMESELKDVSTELKSIVKSM